MSKIRILSAGESHGPKLTGIIDGLPSGFIIDKDCINQDLARRQQGFGRGGRMKIEQDQAYISAGVVQGMSTGAPVAIEIINLDHKNWAQKDIPPYHTPRPGHADFAGALKYDHCDLRISLERASARETAMRTALGSICKQILAQFEIKIISYVTQFGTLKVDTSRALAPADYLNFYQTSLNNEFAFIDDSMIDDIKNHINSIMKAKDTLGGVFESVALGVPIGLGSYAQYDRRLDAMIASAMMSIPAMKAVEIGDGIKNASLSGTQVHDEFAIHDDKVTRTSNRAGGLEGGMSNGMPIVIRTYMKPISTTLNPRKSLNMATYEPAVTVYERSDFCAVQRAAVIGEAMLSLVLLDALTDKIGGDSKTSMMRSFKDMNQGRLNELSIKTKTWRFNYDTPQQL